MSTALDLADRAAVAATARRWALAAALAVTTVAVLALIGWVGDWPVLYRGPVGLPSLKVNTALGLLALAGALALRSQRAAALPSGAPLGPRPALALTGLLGLPLAIGLATLAATLAGINLGLDQLLVQDRGSAPPLIPGRPSLVSALGLISLAVALALVGRSGWRKLVQALLAATATAAWFSLLGLAFDAQQLQGLDWFRTLSLPAAASFLVLVVGVWCLEPEVGVFRLLTLPGVAGSTARGLLPVAAVVPAVFGWLRVLGQRAGYYDLEIGVALFAVATSLALIVAGWRSATALERLDRQRRSAEAAAAERLAEARAAVARAHAAELAAERAVERLAVATAAAGIGIWDWDFTSGRLHWDEQMHRLYGLPPGSFGGRYEDWEARVDPADLASLRAAGQAAIAGGQDLDLTFGIRRRDGEPRVIRERAVVRFDADRRPERMVGINEDVTAERASADALRAAELRFRGIFNSAFHYIGLLSPDGRLLEANQSALDLAGVRADEVVGRPLWETPWWPTAPAAQEQLRQALRRAAAGELVRLQTSWSRRDGGEVVLDVSLKPLYDEQGRVTLLIPEGADVTEMVRATAALRESEERLRHAFDHAPIGMAILGFDGRFLRVNAAMTRITGYGEDELLARTFGDITHPDDRGPDLDVLRQVREGQMSQYQFTKRYRHRAGHVVWVQVSGSVVRDLAGEPLHLVSQIQDITRRQEAEAALRASLAEKEVLLKEIHHRVKNNLQVVSSLLQLQSSQSADPAVRTMFREAQDRIRMMGMVHERLYRSGNLATIDFAAHLRDLVGLVARSAGRVDCAVELVLELAAVELDLDAAIPLGLIATELVTNCYKHAFVGLRRGRIEIALGRREERLHLRVADDGVGIAPDRDLRAGGSLGMRLVWGLCGQLDAELLHGPAGDGERPGVCFAVTMRDLRAEP